MRVFNAHSDIITTLTYKRREGETKVFDRLFAPSFHEGGVTGSIFVLWTDEAHQDNYPAWVETMYTCAREEEKESKTFRFVTTIDEYHEALKEEKIGIFLGMEGLAALEGDVEGIDRWYQRGVRHMGLTWNEKNPFASGVPHEGGVTEAGRAALRRMEELGILIDVSHLNDPSFWDVLETTNGLVVATHSNARALASHRRNLTDDMLRALKDHGGLVGLNAATDFISDDKARQNLDGMVRQIDHLLNIMGTDGLMFGFDFMECLPKEAQGTLAPPPGETSTAPELLEERHIPRLLEAMKAYGLSEKDIAAIANENAENAMARVAGK